MSKVTVVQEALCMWDELRVGDWYVSPYDHTLRIKIGTGYGPGVSVDVRNGQTNGGSTWPDDLDLDRVWRRVNVKITVEP